MVAGHLVMFSALLIQTHPETPVLRVDILHLHTQGRADPCKRIDHESDQRPVAQADLRGRVDRVE